MYCKTCGKELDNNALFCPNCGEAVGNESIAEKKASANEVPAAKQGGGKSKALIGIIAAVLVIVLIIVGVAVGGGDKSPNDSGAADAQENQELNGIDVKTIYLPEYSEAITIQEAMISTLENVDWLNYEENGSIYLKGEGELLCTDEIIRTITVILIKGESGYTPEAVYVEGVSADPPGPILEEIYAAAASGDNSVLAAWLSEEEAVEEEAEAEQSSNNTTNGVMNDAAQVMMNLLYDAVFNWDNNSASLYSLWNQGLQAYEYALGDVNGDGNGDAVIKLGNLNGVLIVYSVNGLYYGETVSADSASGLDWHGMEYIQSRGWSLSDDYLFSFNVDATFF